MKSNPVLAFPLLVACLLLSSCNYDFPLTEKPTRKIDARLLGDWVAIDPNSEKPDQMRVRQFDDFTYAISMDNEIYRVFHTDFADTAFVSAQDLKPGNRKYFYYAWHLSANGTQLTLKGVRTEVVPENAKTTAEIQRLIRENLSNPKLFQAELQFKKRKSGNN